MTELDALIAEFLLPLQLAGIECYYRDSYIQTATRGVHLCKEITIRNRAVSLNDEDSKVCGQTFEDYPHALAIMAESFRPSYVQKEDHDGQIIHDYLEAYVKAYLERNSING